MAVNSNGDLYPPFPPPQSMGSEEGPQSSEDGSGMHSPVFPSAYSMHGDSRKYICCYHYVFSTLPTLFLLYLRSKKVRYHDHVDVHHSAGLIAPQYDYTHPLNAQQPPILDTTSLELPNSSARHASFNNSPHYTSIPRNHLGLEAYSIQSPVSSRIPPPAPLTSPIDYPRYPSERPLPGGPSHESSYTTRPIAASSGIPMEPDHRPPPVPSVSRSDTTPATTQPSTSTREPRKEINQVIACRQCRSRKIRCDSQRPSCNNCLRRSNDCQYDSAPKRRGPDKNPGTRQRSCKRRPTDGSAPPPPKRAKRSASDRTSTTAPNTEQRGSLPSPTVKENMQDNKRTSPTSYRLNDRQPPSQPPQPQHPIPARQPLPDLHYHPPHHHMGIHPHHPHHHPQGPPSPTDPRIMPTPDSQYKVCIRFLHQYTHIYLLCLFFFFFFNSHF
ncbi:hypothetical protein CVT24_007698 [Panaeolus cyanescens]|uniref:Zn(2)-C6 fungal-type domain-containing protein n=1 Tax=Panaeolus cyanescens TaxID=181874 RepID=A0A409VRF6_9AGAR|nr:hypothetical protein CVT24_007698 [Panaeolus cyanescens]